MDGQEGAFITWASIVRKYREQKETFFVKLNPPFSIYITADTKLPVLEKYVCINEIPHEDLDLYPQAVRNLLHDAKCGDSNVYFVLRRTPGWLIIGSANRIEDTTRSTMAPSNMDILDVFNQGESENCSFAYEGFEKTITVFNHNLETTDLLSENTKHKRLRQKNNSFLLPIKIGAVYSLDRDKTVSYNNLPRHLIVSQSDADQLQPDEVIVISDDEDDDHIITYDIKCTLPPQRPMCEKWNKQLT